MIILTVDLKLDGIFVLTAETEISDYMAGAFLEADSAALKESILDLRRQILAIDADDERLDIGQRFQFACACSILSALSGKVTTEHGVT